MGLFYYFVIENIVSYFDIGCYAECDVFCNSLAGVANERLSITCNVHFLSQGGAIVTSHVVNPDFSGMNYIRRL